MTTRKLHISDDISLPLDAATQTIAVIARKGAGKTYAASQARRELLEHDVQVGGHGHRRQLVRAPDRVPNGKDRGFDIPVLGGLRGDVPLTPESGALIADLVVDTGRSFILDLSQFSLAARKKFATCLRRAALEAEEGRGRADAGARGARGVPADHPPVRRP
jgi:hypothetical protein